MTQGKTWTGSSSLDSVPLDVNLQTRGFADGMTREPYYA